MVHPCFGDKKSSSILTSCTTRCGLLTLFESRETVRTLAESKSMFWQQGKTVDFYIFLQETRRIGKLVTVFCFAGVCFYPQKSNPGHKNFKNLLTNAIKYDIIHNVSQICGIGGIGRHIRFKLGCRKAQGFEYHIPHKRDGLNQRL